jgi:hypothetical protein
MNKAGSDKSPSFKSAHSKQQVLWREKNWEGGTSIYIGLLMIKGVLMTITKPNLFATSRTAPNMAGPVPQGANGTTHW